MKTLNTLVVITSTLLLITACSDNSSVQKVEETKIPTAKTKVDYQMEVDLDVKKFRSYFSDKFPNNEIADFKDGVYAIDDASKQQWLEIEEFPPYELAIDEGLEFFETPFSNGQTYASCFENAGQSIRQNYPYFDTESNQVITLELAINQCREKNGEAPLTYGMGELAAISAYMANSSRDKVFDVKVPNEQAYAAYMNGKQFFYSKRGQLNFSCSDCHLKISGSHLRADILSPAIGHPTGMPVYRSNWGELGTIGHRYRECNKNVRAKPLPYQSEAYRNLEYFQTIMSNGLAVNGPSSRK